MNAKEQTSPLMCDPATGICEVPQSVSMNAEGAVAQKPVRLLYFTDPICSSCWGIEPQLRKLKSEYGDYFTIEYRMGGLLKGWDAYGGSDVSNPTDVAQHWDEASAHYDMPIDGDVWVEDPLSSSYPPSIAFKAAQMQDAEKALKFLRRIKEMVFLEKKNITRWEHLSQAAVDSGLDAAQLKKDFEGEAKKHFEEDLAMARQLGVRGFPTIFFSDAEENRFKVYGSKPYEAYEQALLKLYPQAVKNTVQVSSETVFQRYPSVTTKEFAVLTNKNTIEAESILEHLYERHEIEKQSSKNGVLWRSKQPVK